jgi:di/tricarboxylate transporter
LVVLVVHRQGDAAGPEPTALEAGDVLLVRGDWRRLADNLRDSDALVLDRPEDVRRHLVPWGPGARRTLWIVLALVVLLATGAVPPAVAGLLAAGALVVTRVLSIEAAYHGINWTIVLIAGLIPISTAMTTSGPLTTSPARSPA